MLWTAVWFLINILFVVSLIVFLFMHRTVTEAKNQSANSAVVSSALRRRNSIGLLSLLLFVAMCISFLVNMRLNG